MSVMFKVEASFEASHSTISPSHTIQHHLQAMAMERNSPKGPVVATSKEAQVILPPPSPTNPVPTLPAALRLDNNEQLLTLLQTNPTGSSDTAFRQLLVFADDDLRTLLLRQVVTDPNTRVFKGKKNWDAQHSFFGLPRSVIGTRVMPKSSMAGGSGPRVKTDATLEGEEVLLLQDESWDDDSVDAITYFLRASALSKTAQLIDKIRSWDRSTHHRVVYLPQPTAIVQKMWSTGMLSTTSVSIHKLQLDIFPLEPDVLSLEYGDAMKETDVDRIPSTLITTVARSLLKIQDVVGTVPRVQSLGPLGEEVVRKMMALKLEEHSASSSSSSTPEVSDASEVDAMIIMDRKIDLVTPMLTPLTYEGLLDDIVGIDCGFIKIDVNVLNPDDDNAKPVQSSKEIVSLAVTGSDTLYAEVRDQHVEKFGSFLQNQAKALRESHANFTNKEKKKDLSEIHQFVKQIPVRQALYVHAQCSIFRRLRC